MKKAVVCAGLSIVAILAFGGCSGSTPAPEASNGVEAKLSSSHPIAYAYMQDGEKLLYISTVYEQPSNEDIEVIRITTGGFYPNYSMNTKTENGGGGEKTCMTVMKDSDRNKAFCDSHYTSREALMTGVAALWNAAATVTTVGLNVASGAIVDPKYFHKESFLEVVKENQLPTYRTALLELNKYADQEAAAVNSLYDPAYNAYKENLQNITFKHAVSDNSGLLVERDLDPHYAIELQAPKRIQYSYGHFYKDLRISPSDFTAEIDKIKLAIAEQAKNDRAYYQDYLAKGFSKYRVAGAPEKEFRHNKYIVFHSTIEAPAEIPYNPGEKMEVPVSITVNYANLYHIVPKSYQLGDANVKIDFHVNENLRVSAIASNQTNSFITLSSLTSYYKEGVYNHSNVNREIAPQSKTLPSNSTYDLLSGDMIKESAFEKVTKKKASNTYITYGFASKYRINNTNVDQSLYSTAKYSLLELYKQYL
jgi:hypothetical protein